ncbi:DNA-binding HxlR family transcriptional regulator [Pseudorhizobium tarimense]|uniref:DNA-binding HxlR family transcriptional regulator n=1 Tax=Pseudorhizobium tarimense TaxID=1079109 RepID=A0ABV2HDS2_9HYPH|nr:helix-turn-helix domain-containing protein [Pseudorhizobium tarimense]MCJ8520984.1 helix-turn-helix transcriptional regulator [Pseudorhizobium tarimense]MCJ8521035.1 helix-turn-helix transcriptional regulator [Pseudorhizobium tarimense]
MANDALELPLDVAATRPILEQIANKWAVLILSVLCTQPARFNDLKRRLDGITHKALSDALKRLERNGLISRKVLPTQPVGVEYTITALGASLREPFAALYNWSLANGTELTGAQLAYDGMRRNGAFKEEV